MKSGFFILLCISGFFSVSSCETNKDKSLNSFTITAGSICGWCAGTDSVVITRELTKFEFANCDTRFSKSVLTKESDWAALENTLDLTEFLKINLNTCYVCADGCDYWVEIRSASFRYRIRYGHEDSAVVRTIQPFLENVHSIRGRFRTEN